MFIRIPNFEIGNDGRLHKVEYDYSSSPDKQTREQRENALLDIELGILRNKQVAQALFNPGSFDEIKRESRIAQILSDRANNGSSLITIWQEEHKIPYADIDKAIESVNKASLKELKKFVERFSEKRSLLSLDTFIYNHQQNMSGAALIGMYANNTTGQAKMQTTDLAIRDAYTFTIEGRLIKSLHDMYSTKNGVRERISKRCAYFSAASVDNVKDPCLRKIGQNTNTASIAGFMLRAGLDVQEISLLFSQPFIKFCIDKSGDIPSSKTLTKHFDYLNKRYGTAISGKEVMKLLGSHNFTVKELAKNIIQDGRYRFLNERDIANLDLKEREEFVRNTMLALALFNRIANLSDQLRGSVQISRADSPNGAISNELHKANRQVQAVSEYMARESEKDWGIDNISDIMGNHVVDLSMSKDEMRKKLLDTKIPRLQAFYSLGIEFASELIAPYFMSQSRECQNLVRRIESVVERRLSDDDLKILYNDFITYLLSGTQEFGDSAEGTFEEKRDYYLYQYPQKFSEILKKNPQLASSPALSNLRVSQGEIIMERSGKITPTLRESIMTGFDSMLFGSDPEAQQVAYDLFRYAFYNEGFIFRHNSYGQFFSASFLSSFEDVLDALRVVPDARMMNNFFEQWVAQRHNINHFHILPESANVDNLDDYCITWDNREGENVPEYVVYKDELYAYHGKSETGAEIYSWVPNIDAGPTEGRLHKFNANQPASEVASHVVDQSRVENLKKLNAVSFRQQVSSERGADTSTADMLENEEAFVNEIEGVESFLDDTDFIMEWTDRSDFLEFAEQAQEEYDESLGQKTLTDKGEKPLC